MQCVYDKSNAFKALVEHYHLSGDTLKDIIHKYWIETGSEENFPSDIYINAQLGKGQYIEKGNAVREMWEKQYKNPIEIDSTEELKAAKEKALRYFPASAITVYQNDKDHYMLAVREPVKVINDLKSIAGNEALTDQEMSDYELISRNFIKELENNRNFSTVKRLNNRLEKEKKLHTDITAIDEAVKTGQWTPETIEQFNNLIKDIKDGQVDFKRTVGERLSFTEGISDIHAGASLVIRAKTGASEKKRGNPQEEYEIDAKEGKQQEEIIEAWAKAADLWLNDYEDADGNKANTLEDLLNSQWDYLNVGSEAVVHEYDDTNVIKAMNLSHANDNPGKLLDRISLFNKLFPETAMEVVGFGRDAQGHFRVIVIQPHIEGTELSEEDLDDFHNKYKLDKQGTWFSSKDKTALITDLSPSNIIKDKEGNYFIIDADVVYNTPKRGGNVKFANILSITNKSINESLDTLQMSIDSNPALHAGQSSALTQEITSQLIDHLKSIGINVLDRAAMEKYLSEHGIKSIQQAVKRNIFNSDLKKSEIKAIQDYIESLPKETDTSKGLYLVDYEKGFVYKFNTSLVQYSDNRKLKRDGFEIIDKRDISNFNKEQLKYIEDGIRNGKTLDSVFNLARDWDAKRALYNSDVIVENGETNRDNDRLDTETLQGESIRGKDNTDSGENIRSYYVKKFIANEQGDLLRLYITPQGEIYGFVDKPGNMYLDETIISPEHPIHEYTHLWDRAVAQKNPEFWKTGVEIMKQTSLWQDILNNPNYGQKWKSTDGMTDAKLESLIASEVHSRLTGQRGLEVLNTIAKEKGQKGIVAKLKQWLLDFWTELKSAFTPWTDTELQELKDLAAKDIDKALQKLSDMTLKDFSEGVNPMTQQMQQSQSKNNVEIFNGYWTREQVANQQDKIFLFGDNTNDRVSTHYVPSSTQAVIRGLPNAIGIDTKKNRGTAASSYFTDADFDQFKAQVDAALSTAKADDRTIVIPADGIGTGKAMLKEKAPRCFNYLQSELQKLQNFTQQQAPVPSESPESTVSESEDDGYESALTKEEEQEVQQKLGTIGELNQKINTLYESGLIPASEILHVAELIMNQVSDDVTRIQNEPEIIKQWFPSLSTNLDFKTATRKQIIETVGINRLIEGAKNMFDSSNHDYDDIETELQADLITDNWDAIVTFGTKVFAMNEGFGIKMDYKDGGYVLADGMKLGFDDLNTQGDIDSIREQEGDDQEHWQIEQRTLDILNSASEIIRMAIHGCYQIGKDGKPVVSKWDIRERMNPKQAITSILAWTQGALTLDDMVSRLMEKQVEHPWLSQLTDRLRVVEGQENPNADFQSQFFNTMCRSFQSYTIVVMDNGKYTAVPANDHPSRKKIMDSIEAQFRMKEHPLFKDKGINRINGELLGNESTENSEDMNLYKAVKELKDIFEIKGKFNTDEAYRKLDKQGLSDEEIAKAKEILSGAFRILGFDPSQEIMDRVATSDNIVTMASKLQFIINNLTKARAQQIEGKTYDPFKFKGDNSIGGTLRSLLDPITDLMDEVVPNVVYDDGKLYQAYVTPSYLTLLFEKFHWKGQEFKDFLEKEYGYSEWFKYPNSDTYRGGWLSLLATSQEARDAFAHTVELNFNKKRYMKNMSDAEYAVSLLTHYLAESTEVTGRELAWYRVPMQSNKPSSEYIRFYSYRGNGYKDKIAEGMYDMFLQEVNRIQTVRMRNLDKTRTGYIKGFDENGRKFNFLPYLNAYLSNGNAENRTLLSEKDGISAERRNKDLADAIQALENFKKPKDDSYMRTLVIDAIKAYMQQEADAQMQEWEKSGILEAALNIKGIYPPEVEKNKESKMQFVRMHAENFIWNDHYAANNILQLTIGDKAAYKDADELQKRLAELHAPGIRANVKATDYKGKPVSDGKYRTIIIKDFEGFKSNIIENLSEVFEKEIEKAPDDQKASWRALKEELIGENGRFRKINVTDGQGYCSPSSYRKKALMFGRWSQKAEQIYQNLRNGDYTLEDIETTFQPLKPFVYTQLHKDMGVTNAPIHKMPIPFQAKNSEYLLIMADALMRNYNTKRPNLLKAIYDVMEDSEVTMPTQGIDTIQFESAIKSGLQGAVDLNQFIYDEKGETKAREYLDKLVYVRDNNGKIQQYNTQNFVQEGDYEGYCLQQEVPDHFRNHNQAHGSQERMIIPSDLVASINDETVYYEWTDPDGTKRKANAKDFADEYEQTIANNVNDSIRQLRAELKLDSLDTRERNLALSEILQKEILDSSRYGIDMFLACGLDPETGDFRIPLGDPIQAKRIEQLLNSIIKSRINKQEIAGGPIVQVTNWGTSKQLHIRFKDKSGNLLMTEEEWKAKNPSGSHAEFKKYVKDNQAGMAYYEVFAPAWMKDLYKNFIDKAGNIDIEALEIINPDLLKMVSYRIPTEEKYSIAPMKVVGFMPERAGSAIMFPYELTEIDDSDFDVDKRYVMRKVIEIGTRYELKEGENSTEAEKDYVEHNKKSIIEYLKKEVDIPNKTTKEERDEIEKKAKAIVEVDKRTAKRAHEERLADIERRNAMIEEVEMGIEFSNNEERSDAIYDNRARRQEKKYDKDIAKENKRYEIELAKIDARAIESISKEITKLENKKVNERINEFLTVDRWINSSKDDIITRQLRTAYLHYMHPTYEDTTGKLANDNKIIDMTWGVLTNEAMTSQLLNPGGFDNLKKIGYMIAAYSNPNNKYSWAELEKMPVDKLKDLYHSEKDLSWIGTQIQYYRQNAAAASLIGIFAVNKVAHAILERDNLTIDVEKFCGDKPFMIAGMEFSGLMDVDPSHDSEGALIGKIIGSGVSASADAAKTPVLHLMNINPTTVNLFTTLIRLGMSYKDASLFLGQSIVGDVLREFNRKNLNNYEPLSNIITQRLLRIQKEQKLSEDSIANTEELSREELIEGLTSREHPETDYKVLLAFQKVNSLAEAMRNPTFATRLNSISSAVGPQIVDNLILEHKVDKFSQAEESGFYDADGAPANIFTILNNHPVLAAFYQGIGIARSLFKEMPAGSTSFRNLLTHLPGNLADRIFQDKKLLSDLSTFFQSYLLIRSGLIDETKLNEFIVEFPKEFTTADKDGRTIKDKYPDNALIQNISYTYSKRTGRTFLNIPITGEDELTKDAYRTAWIDLHKNDPELSKKLFTYFFFRAGIGFSPKTGMALVPTFVKQRLNGTNKEGDIVTYADVYRNIPELKEEAIRVIDQFIRNNWSNNKLVPRKGGEGTNYKYESDGKNVTLTVYTEEDMADLIGVVYMKTYKNGETTLWRLDESTAGAKYRKYNRIDPLGDNNEYLEMSTKDIIKPYSKTTLEIEDSDPSELESKGNAEMSGEETTPVPVSDAQITEGMLTVAQGMISLWEANGRKAKVSDAISKINEVRGNERKFANFLVNVFNQLGLNLSRDEAIEKFKELC